MPHGAAEGTENMGMENGTATVRSAVIRGAEAVPVEVAAVLRAGIPGISVVGMPDASVIEARSRIRCALRSIGFEVPRGSVTVALSPADVRKTGTGLDLAMAAAILGASGQVDAGALDGRMLYGELRVDGGIVEPRGAEAARQLAAREGVALVTAAGASGMRGGFLALDSLGSLRGRLALSERAVSAEPVAPVGDMGDVPGNAAAKRALAVAAASGLGALLLGDEEAARELARRVPGIMGELGDGLADEIGAIGSLVGRRDGKARRPFVEIAPESSARRIVGGGRPVAPGAVTEAHGGVLFIPRAGEMRAPSRQLLSAAVREGEAALVRVEGLYRMPARALPVLSAPTCPCGGFGRGECRCSARTVEGYRARLLLGTDALAPIRASVEAEADRTQGTAELREAVERARETASERGDERMVAPDAAEALEALAAGVRRPGRRGHGGEPGDALPPR